MAEPIGDFADTNKTKAEPQKAGLPNPFEGASKITFIGELPPEEIPERYAGRVAFAFEATFPEPEEPASCNEFPPQKKEPVRVAFTYEDLPRVFALSTPHNLTTAQFVVPHDHALTFFELLFRAAEDPAFTEDERQLFRAILNKFQDTLNEQAPGTIAMLEVSVTDPEGKGVPPIADFLIPTIADFLIPKPKDYQPDVQPDNTNPVFTYVGRAVIAGSAEPVHLWEFPGYGGKYSLAGGIGVTTAALFSALCDQSITTLEAATDEAKAGLIELLTTTASIPTLFYLDSSESGHDYTPTDPERVFVRQVITALKQSAVPVRLNIQALRKAANLPPSEVPMNKISRPPLSDPTGFTKFATNHSLHGAAKAILSPELWEPDEAGRPRYVYRTKKGTSTFHILFPRIPGANPEVANAELGQEILKGFGIDTAALHVLCSAYAMGEELRNDPNAFFAIPGKEIERVLGLSERKANRNGEWQRLTPFEQREAALAELRRLFSLGAELVEYYPAGKKTKQKDGTYRQNIRFEKSLSHLWHWRVREYGAASAVFDEHGEAIKDAKGEPRMLYADWHIEVNPGTWAEVFLHGQTDLRQYGYVAKTLITEIDRRKGKLPFQLGLTLFLKSRLEQWDTLKVSVRAMLDMIPANPTTKADRYTTFNQVVDACHEQDRWGFRADFSSWPESFRLKAEGPDSADTPASLPRNYWETFECLSVPFTPSAQLPRTHIRQLTEVDTTRARARNREEPKAAIQEAKVRVIPQQEKNAPAERSTPPQPRKKGNKGRWNGSAVKELRAALGLTQTELAAHLGKSRPLVALIEQGRRTLSPTDRRVLEGLASRLNAPKQ